MLEPIEWAAVDWGTSNVRVWGVGTDGRHTAPSVSTNGMSRLSPSQFPKVLEDLLVGFTQINGRALEVVICGMAGARDGWCEAPYLAVPTSLSELGKRAVSPTNAPAGLVPVILPGMCQRQTENEDIMRGEETQLLGLLAARPQYSGVVVMPGTHSKWAQLDNGHLVDFVTAMTGELYSAITIGTVLRHSFDPNAAGEEYEAGVEAGLKAGLDAPGRVTALMFRARAAALLSGREQAWSSGYLSGLLIGAEVGGHRSWLSARTTVPIIGSARLGASYAKALAKIGIEGEILDASEVTVAGLKLARKERLN
ncbi:MAG: 2-dehydro-3-deoxygalactonokinase [Alphaproteobacteria bacterium]|nr:2-dehydro-3-deoxygalactonokinase [Alphaproteobacteria bacterium]